jgi:plastocyanin
MRRVPCLVTLSLILMSILLSSDAGAQGGQQTVTVSVQDFYFSPAQLVIEPGTTVRWVNQGTVPHSVVSTDSGPLASQVLQTGGTYQFTFQNPGTYTYHCSIHPSMTASITVTGGEATTSQGGKTTQLSEGAEQAPPPTGQMAGGRWSTTALIVTALLGGVTGALVGWTFRGAWIFRRRW